MLDGVRKVCTAYLAKDAHLIAAAPDLLEICEEVLEEISDPDLYKKMEKTIIKAKGEM